MDRVFKDRMDGLTADFRKLGVSMEDNINVIEGAVGSDIINIYADREQALEDMAIKIEESKKNMFILAVSGTDFFTLNAALQTPFEEKVLPPHSLEDEIKILLIDPFSHAAKERAEVEQPTENYYDTELKSDIFKAIGRIKELKDGNAKIDAHFYSHSPVVFVLRVDDYMFIEPYHLGYVKKTIGTLGCIGKQVPIFLVTSKSSLFERLCKHFDNIWKKSESLEDILKLKNWLRTKGRENNIIKDKLPQYPARTGKYKEVLALIENEEKR